MARLQSRKKSQGRRKIEMKLIADENARTVTFSKRRAGLFKKATELSILCGTQIALIIFSLGGRAYSFGHPDVNSVVERFLGGNPAPNLWDSVHGRRLHGAMMHQLKEQCDEKSEQLANKKRKGKEIEAALDNLPFPTTEERLSQLTYHQLVNLKEIFEKFRDLVRSRVRSAQVGVSFEPPKSMDVAGLSKVTDVAAEPSKAMNVAGPSMMTDAAAEPSKAMNVAGPSLMTDAVAEHSKAMNVAESQTAKKVDLSNIETDGLGDDASPIPADWLKL